MNDLDIAEKTLGRTLTKSEKNVLSVLFSEHCSYRSSIDLLSKFYNKNSSVFSCEGENAGIVKINDDVGIAFKMESHNHPCMTDPFQGSATGVGGIIRDIIAVGARPIGIMNVFFLGDINHNLTPQQFKECTKGVAFYGNRIGLPNIGGMTHFSESYNNNTLVNALCVGLVDLKNVCSCQNAQPSMSVLYIGKKTKIEGVASASDASKNTEKMNNLPEADPLYGYMLTKCVLDIVQNNLSKTIQDMGAAGIASSIFEICKKSYCGMEIHLDKIPCTFPNASLDEILLSETQERMIILCSQDKSEAIQNKASFWDLPCAIIGKTTKKREITIKKGNNIVSNFSTTVLDIPLSSHRASQKKKEIVFSSLSEKEKNPNLREIIPLVLKHPNSVSKHSVYEIYDSHINMRNTSEKLSDASSLDINSIECISLTCDSSIYTLKHHPYQGALLTVCESWRNTISSGFIPKAITNNMNFGNPHDPHVAYEMEEIAKGMNEACIFFDLPIISGNVSLYNSSSDSSYNIPPTLVVGCLGVGKKKNRNIKTPSLKEGMSVWLVGETEEWIHCGLYFSDILKKVSPPPRLQLEEEKKNGLFILDMIEEDHIILCHDISEGGILLALYEIAFYSEKGIIVDKGIWNSCNLLSESPSRYIFISEKKSDNIIISKASEKAVFIQKIGSISQDHRISGLNNESLLDIQLYRKDFSESLSRLF